MTLTYYNLVRETYITKHEDKLEGNVFIIAAMH